jgi:molybdate transport system ATP-binding protein
MDPSILLQLRGVSVRAGSRLALRRIDWTLRRGEQWALLGGNGAGKSLLASLLGGQLRPSGGTLQRAPELDGRGAVVLLSNEVQDAWCRSDARHDISDFLGDGSDPGTRVRDAIDPGGAGDVVLDRLLERLQLGDLLDRGLRGLSSGEMRRVMLARALWRRPPLLILDDPFASLDQGIRPAVQDLVAESVADGQQLLVLARRPAELPGGLTHWAVLADGSMRAAGPSSTEAVRHAARDLDAPPTAVAPLPPAPAAALSDGGELLSLRDVECRYGGRPVLSRLDLIVHGGQHTSLSGPNGCGKSTLLSLISGDNPRAYGQAIRVFGRGRDEGGSIWALKRRIGQVSNALHRAYPQRCPLLDVLLSGYHDSLGLFETARATELTRARAWLRSLGFEARARRPFASLSYGDQRLLLIVRAVIKSPPLLILDEPCSGLDATRRQQVLALVDAIIEAGHSTVLYVSHDPQEIPAGIVQRLVFRPRGDGGYRLQPEAPPPL